MLRLPFLNLKKSKDLENSFLGITFDSLRVNVVYFEISLAELNPAIQVKRVISRFIGEKTENLFKEYPDDSALIETLRVILTELSGEFSDVSNQVIFGLSADRCIDLMSIVSLKNSMRRRFTEEQAKELDEQAYKNASFRAQDILATQVGDMESDLDLVASVDIFKKIDGVITRDPVGLEGEELEQAWFGSFVRRADLERFKQVAKKLNLKILTVSSLNYAFYTCLIQHDQKYNNCVVVDLNNDLTQVSVAFGGSIVGSRFINIGLVSVLNEIVSRLELYPDEAWEVLEKYRQGTLDSSLAQKVQEIIHRFFIVWSKALSEVFSDFSGIKTFSSNVVLVGPGFDIPDLYMLTSNEPWFKSVPFKAPPNFEKGLVSDKITKVLDLTGKSSLFAWSLPISLSSVYVKMKDTS